jgi:hypothetical protein
MWGGEILLTNIFPFLLRVRCILSISSNYDSNKSSSLGSFASSLFTADKRLNSRGCDKTKHQPCILASYRVLRVALLHRPPSSPSPIPAENILVHLIDKLIVYEAARIVMLQHSND